MGWIGEIAGGWGTWCQLAINQQDQLQVYPYRSHGAIKEQSPISAPGGDEIIKIEGMAPKTTTSGKHFCRRVLQAVLVLALAWLWVFLAATPAT